MSQGQRHTHRIGKAAAAVAVVIGAVAPATAAACPAVALRFEHNASVRAARPSVPATPTLKPFHHGLDEFTLKPRTVAVSSRNAAIAATSPAAAGFDYTDAGIGAATALVAVLAGGGSAVMIRRHRATQPAAL